VPTYQYACTECDHFFDAVQSFSDDSLTVCPECRGKLRKVFNAVGVVFKGSGFYRNDSRDSSTTTTPAAASTAGESSSAGESSGGGSSTTTVTESKPAAKPAAKAAATSD
jgi:putative FmdB family regulatory protein